MVKKGEYLDFAIELEKKTVDFSTNVKDDEITVNTELSILLELVKKVEALEERIKKLEGAKA